MLKERRIVLLGTDGQERSYTLRYRLTDRREIERHCGKGLWDAIYGGEIEHQAALVWGGLVWKNPNLTVEKVLNLLSAHAEGGGDVDIVLRHALWACIENGLLKVKDRDRLLNLMPDPAVPAEAAEEAEGDDGARGKDEPVKPASGY